MRTVRLAVLPIVVFVLAGTAAAQDRDGQWQGCTLYSEHGKVRANASLDLVIDACTAIIQANQETPKRLAFALANRGYAYRNKHDYDRAIQDLDQAIKLDPDNALAFVNRGDAYRNKREYDRAIRDYDQAIKLDPNNAITFNDRGSAYGGRRDYDRAIQDYDEAIRLDPNLARAFYNRGIAYYIRTSTTWPSRTTTRRSGLTRISPPLSTTAAIPTAASATTTAPSKTSARRSDSSRTSPAPLLIAGMPTAASANTTAPSRT